jgi:diguanylate cyclase (GGDEF)-like protein
MGTTFEVDGRPARYLVVHRTAEADWFDDEDRKALETITAVAVTSINRRRLADEMFHLARHDALTGLYNRAVFASRLDQALDSPRQGRAPAVLYCDLDGFKTVNDRLGHDAGDRLLLAVAERIRAALRPEDMAARLGGDEFAILLDAADPGMAEQVAERLLEALRAHFLVDGAAAHLSASIGIVYAAGERRGVDLLSKADTAMYRAKAHGKDRAELFLPEMRAEDLHRLHLEDALRDAVHRRLIKHALQPIVELGTGRIVGFEALARWHDADLGNVPPDVFIPAAERLGLVGQLGSQILEEAHLLARMMRDQAGRPFGIWINLAPSQVVDPLLAARVAELIQQNPDIPIVLELTERSVLTDDQRTTRALTALSAAGATLALDDFGVGYSSIGYLQRFPVEIIKVDKTFMQNLADPHGLALVQAILAMALALDLEVVAEGLESWPACATMRRLGTTLGQGHLFAKPLSSQQALLLAQVGEVDVTTLDNVEVLSAGPRGRTAPGRALRGV